MPINDSLIAATAPTHDLPVVTRNRRDFEQARLPLADDLREHRASAAPHVRHSVNLSDCPAHVYSRNTPGHSLSPNPSRN